VAVKLLLQLQIRHQFVRQITLKFVICNKTVKSHQQKISSKYDAQPKSGIWNRDGRKDEAYRSKNKWEEKRRDGGIGDSLSRRTRQRKKKIWYRINKMASFFFTSLCHSVFCISSDEKLPFVACNQSKPRVTHEIKFKHWGYNMQPGQGGSQATCVGDRCVQSNGRMMTAG